MKRFSAQLRAVFVLPALLMLAACAVQTAAPGARGAAYHEAEAAEVFSAGFRNIESRALNPVETRDFVLTGLGGLKAIDPTLSIDADGDKIRVLLSGVPAAAEDAPEDGRVDAWAGLTSRLISAAALHSHPLRRAPAEAVFKAVFNGALTQLDAYSRYAGAEQARRNRAKREGFGGIGVRFKRQDLNIVIARVTPEAPAAKAGIEPGEHILSVDGTRVRGMGLRKIVDLLRGPVGSEVRLILSGADASAGGADTIREISLTRAHIVPQTVSESRADGVVFFTIESFNQDTARSLAEALSAAREGMGARLRGVVLDLRGNPGGLLKQSVEAADVFLTKGGRIVSTRGRHPNSRQVFDSESADESAGVPVIVLIDGKSASAAEIVASALSARGRAVVIGASSYGKGTVQTVIRLPNDGELTLTWSRLITPDGAALHELGVAPDVCTAHASAVLPAPELTEKLRESVRAALDTAGRPPPGEETRRQMRDACPAMRRGGDFELKLAERLFDRPDLFARLLRRPPATAEAPPGS
ncbi:MAG: S41 family peptidase [Rhodospirillales bacterium]